MSSVIAAPELINTAATDLANIGSNLSAAHTAAAASTTGLIPAAADEVSASIAQLFSARAQDYQALAGRAAAFHQQFMQNLTASAGSYASAEAANASFMQPLNAIAGAMGGVESRFGALLSAMGHIPPGQFMQSPVIPGTTMPNPFFDVSPGHVMQMPFIPPSNTMHNPLFGVAPGRWDISQLIQAISTTNGAAAFHQPFMQPLNAASDIQGQNPMNDFFFPIFQIFEDIPQELALLIALLLLL
jgi:hypothetical protein